MMMMMMMTKGLDIEDYPFKVSDTYTYHKISLIMSWFEGSRELNFKCNKIHLFLFLIILFSMTEVIIFILKVQKGLNQVHYYPFRYFWYENELDTRGAYNQTFRDFKVLIWNMVRIKQELLFGRMTFIKDEDWFNINRHLKKKSKSD